MNQLKEAEKKASLLVQDSRKERVDRIKEAKSEAEALIAAYRAEMEANYQKKMNMQSTSGGSAGNALNSTTTNEISSMTNDFKTRRAGVEQMLVDLVLKVNPVAPIARPVL